MSFGIDKTAIIKLCNEINRKDGEGTIFSLGGKYENLKIDRFSTGIEDLDNITGGGLPKGRIIEIYGPESSGKTTLGYHLCGLHQLCLDIPIEGCVSCDTEYFNGYGWKRIDEYKDGEKVLQYNEDGTAELVLPLKYHIKDCNVLYHVKSKHRIDMVISKHHNVVYKTTSKYKTLTIKPFNEIKERLDSNIDGFAGNIPKTFKYNGKGINLSENVIRLMVAVFADGSFRNKGSSLCYMGISKLRKTKRLVLLLNELGIEYRINNQGQYIFYAPFNCKHYPNEWYNMSEHQFRIVIDEMKHWDGCQFMINHMPEFYTIHKDDADFIQFAYTVLGYAAYITIRDNSEKEMYIDGRRINSNRICYAVCSGMKSNIASLRKVKYTKVIPEDGKMYCFTMPSKMWVMRRNDNILVTGNTFDAERAKVFGNHSKQMLVYRARYGEDAMNKTIQFAKNGIPLIVIDSVPSMIPKEDAEKVLKAANKDTIEEQRIGGTARLLNKYLPIIEEIIEITGTTLIFINQVRDKMNAMMFGEKTDTPGGHKLKHSASLRIQVARKAWIKIPNKNPYSSAQEETIGMIMKCKVVKSKVCNPMGECEIPLFFDRGFVSFEALPTIRKELLLARTQQYGKKANKQVLDDLDE